MGENRHLHSRHDGCERKDMRTTVEKLLALQELEFGPGGTEVAVRIGQLRRAIPADALAKYDRLAARKKKPVAIVRNGVCSHCHLHVAVGTMFDLTHDAGSGTCDSCGRFLYVGAVEEQPQPAIVAATTRKTRARATRVAV